MYANLSAICHHQKWCVLILNLVNVVRLSFSLKMIIEWRRGGGAGGR